MCAQKGIFEQSKELCLFSRRRNHGYVYTYRLYRDDAGSWAAEVRHLILFPLMSTCTALVCKLKCQLKRWHSCTCALILAAVRVALALIDKPSIHGEALQ